MPGTAGLGYISTRRLRGTRLPATITPVECLPHGYTNDTRRVGNRIEKRYEGADAVARAEREFTSLTHLLGHCPVPEVVRFDPSVPMVILTEVIGRHGQELIDEGRGSSVLRLVGNQLARLQVLDPSMVPGLNGEGDVIVHGDFGPQNILCDVDLAHVSGILDWELAHVGSPIEDLAWAEWIVRMHHPEALDDLPDLFTTSGLSFSWSDRQAAMVRQCHSYIAYCEASEMKATAVQWKRRLHNTEQWRE